MSAADGDNPLSDLDTRIQKAKNVHHQKTSDGGDPGRNPHAEGWRMLTDLLAGIVVGMFLGYHIDKWLETSPLFFIISTFLGLAAGVLNIYKQVPKEHDADE